MELLSYGDRIPDGRYHVHSRFARAVNFLGDAGLVSLVDASIGAGPLNIAVDRLDPALCSPTLLVDADHFVVGHQALRKNRRRLFCSGMELESRDAERFIDNLNVLGDCIRRAAPSRSLAFLLGSSRPAPVASAYEREFSTTMRDGLCRMMEFRLAEGARTFRGAGFGLTPSGDDFLSGFLLGLNATERLRREDLAEAKTTVFENSIGANPIVNAGLACSREGRVFEPFKDLVSSLARSRDEDVRVSACRVFGEGETSGADAATGFYVSAALFMRSVSLGVL